LFQHNIPANRQTETRYTSQQQTDRACYGATVHAMRVCAVSLFSVTDLLTRLS